MQKKSWESQKMRAQAIDYSILFLVLFLVGFGLVILYSTSSYKGSLLHNDTAYWLKKQAFFAVIGIAGMMIISRLDYHIWKKKWWFAWAVYGGTIALLLLTFVIGAASHGSKRWLPLGPISFQPSELAKITLNLFLAAYISSRARQMRTGKGLLEPFLLVLPIVGIVGIENLSTCIILLAISFIMIFVATPLYKPFLGLIGIGVEMFIISRLGLLFEKKIKDDIDGSLIIIYVCMAVNLVNITRNKFDSTFIFLVYSFLIYFCNKVISGRQRKRIANDVHSNVFMEK